MPAPDCLRRARPCAPFTAITDVRFLFRLPWLTRRPSRLQCLLPPKTPVTEYWRRIELLPGKEKTAMPIRAHVTFISREDSRGGVSRVARKVLDLAGMMPAGTELRELAAANGRGRLC